MGPRILRVVCGTSQGTCVIRRIFGIRDSHSTTPASNIAGWKEHSMSTLRAAMVGFEITPNFHPDHGAWGTTPSVTKLDPNIKGLYSRCLAIAQGDRQVIWYGSDLVGDVVSGTDSWRTELADALNMDVSQVIWSTSQTHSSGAIPGSSVSGSSITNLAPGDSSFIESQRHRLLNAIIDAGRQALDQLQPVEVWAGRGYCDSISYNSRLPMLLGGSKFSRDYAEGKQSDKYFDPTISLVRFDDSSGKTIGTIFNFCCHPAVLIRNEYCSSDWVGTARGCIEEALDNTPAMFVQGFCGDVHPKYMFGTPEQAATLGHRLGQAAVEALPTLVPVRSDRFDCAWKTVELPRQPMPSREMCESGIAKCEAFIEEVLHHNPRAIWVEGYNHPEPDLFSPEDRAASTQNIIKHYRALIGMIDRGHELPPTYSMALGALRLGDVGAAFSPGENLTLTGLRVRGRSPFVHTLVCGDTNGLFGYIGPDEEIHRGGAETDYHWRCAPHAGKFRLPLANGSAQCVTDTLCELLHQVWDGHHNR